MSSYATSKTVQQDQRTFAEQAEVLVGPGSVLAYPTSVSIFGSPESQVGDITFVSHAAAPVETGQSDQLSALIAATLLQPKAEPAAEPFGIGDIVSAVRDIIPSGLAPPAPAAADKPNYILWAAIALGAFLLLR